MCSVGVIKRTCEDVLEGKLNVAGVQGRRFDKGEVVLAYIACC